MSNIYLLRHFKVKDTTFERLNSYEFEQWVKNYDSCDLEFLDIEIPKVDKIYVSSQNRAIKSANHLNLEFKKTDLLKEVEAYPFTDTKMKFSKNFWLAIDRFLWYFNLRKKEPKRQTIQRAKEMMGIIEKDRDVLIVSHGLFLKIIIKELKKSGFDGKCDMSPKNGKIYIFQK